jgi:uncharacterized membrane protein
MPRIVATPRSRNLGLSRYFRCPGLLIQAWTTSPGVLCSAAAKRPGRIGTLPPVGEADRLRSWGRRDWSNPWLLVGIIVAFLLICAWIGWAVHVWSENGARQGLGVLIVWPAIVAVLALISIPFVWAFRVIRASARSPESGADVGSDASDVETS